MLLFGHIGITLGVFFVFSYFALRLKTIIDPKYLAIGALLPDLIDKPLGMIVFASTISNGRIIAHTLVFSITLFLIGLYLYNKRFDIRIITLASGSFFHLMEDHMWKTPQTLFWPFLGWGFPKDQRDNITYLLELLKESFITKFPQVVIGPSRISIHENTFIPVKMGIVPEKIGLIVIVILALNWFKNILNKTSSKDEEIQKETTEKPAITIILLYITGFLTFGLLFVRAIMVF